MVVFCTNIWNHHQGPVAVELAKLLGADFRLLLHQPLDHIWSLERIELGWQLNPPEEDWIIGPPKTIKTVDYSEYAKIAMAAEVLILDGSVPYLDFKMLRQRFKSGKLTMMMGERFFKEKEPSLSFLNFRKMISRLLVRYRFEQAGIHYLTMGHGCATDLEYYGICKNRTWRWGYLTSVSSSCCEKIATEKVRVGWCGRMLDWKHPELLISAIAKLPSNIRDMIEVEIVGDGPLKERLITQVEKLRLDDIIQFRPPIGFQEVRSFMQSLDIFVFPSSRREGWGAVLPEAMDSACAVIACKDAGSTMELVVDGENGYLFSDGDVEQVANRLSFLVENRETRKQVGYNAWKTMQRWSPKEGASRLIQLAQFLTNDSGLEPPKEGLCAKVR